MMTLCLPGYLSNAFTSTWQSAKRNHVRMQFTTHSSHKKRGNQACMKILGTRKKNLETRFW
jgi:hypothetical protein